MYFYKAIFSLFFSFFTLFGIAQIPQNNLVGFWPFNGDADEFYNGTNNGELNGVVLTTDRCGNENSAFLFDGIDDYILCGMDSLGVTDEVSISFWFKKENGDRDIAISKYGDLSNDSGYNIQFDDQGSPQIRGRNRTNQFNESGNNGQSFYTDEWYHLVGIVNQSIWTIYINAVLTGTYDSGLSNTFIGGSANPLTFGRRAYFETSIGSWNYFNGKLDDIAIYNRAITEQEVLQLYLSDCPRALVSVDDQLDDLDFKVYPNPSIDGMIYFESQESMKNVVVTDMLGRQLINRPLNNSTVEQINLSELSAGTYIISLELDSRQIMKKIVLQ